MDWQYIAGFFDGEGSVVYNGKGFRVTITQTNFKVLDEIKQFTKVGMIFEVTKRKAHWKDSWVYLIAKQQDVYLFLMNILKFSVVKKELIKKSLPQIKKIINQQNIKRLKREKIIKNAKQYRIAGLTFRQIGKKLNIDFGYARRLILKN